MVLSMLHHIKPYEGSIGLTGALNRLFFYENMLLSIPAHAVSRVLPSALVRGAESRRRHVQAPYGVKELTCT